MITVYEVTLRGLTVKQDLNGDIRIAIHYDDLLKELSQITVNKSGCIHLTAEKRKTPSSKGDYTHMLPVSRVRKVSAAIPINNNNDSADQW